MSEPSVWWPVPVSASRWFSEEQRREAREYHDPVDRVVLLRSACQGLGLVLVWGAVERQDGAVAWWLVVGLVLAVTALPRIAADAWHEFCHEPRFGVSPVAGQAFAVTAVGRAGIETAILVVAISVLGALDTTPVSTIAVAWAVGAIPVASAVVAPRVALFLHRAVDVPSGHEAQHHVAALAEVHQLTVPRLVELDPTSFSGANAYVTGRRSNLTVAVSKRLLEGPDDLLRHVVAHEITHLRRHHAFWSTLAASASAAATIGVALVITTSVADGSTRLPVFVLTSALVAQPFRLGLAWLSRANERQADRSAMRDAPISPELIKQLHLSDRPMLEPSLVARLQSSHPAPAERLESADRSLNSLPRHSSARS